MRTHSNLAGLMLPLVVLLAIGCSDAAGGATLGGGAKSGSGGSGTGNTGGTLGIGAETGGGSGGGGGVIQGEPPCSQSNPDLDADGDGFTPSQGDCNDCTDQMNPGAYDFPGNNVDDDCDGSKDNEPLGCDSGGLSISSEYPGHALTAVDLCRAQTGASWGVLGVDYLKADGQPGMNRLSHGILDKFGTLSPRNGASMLALSTGTARDRDQPGFKNPLAQELFNVLDMGTSSPSPPGFPVAAPACPNQVASDPVANDPAALRLRIKVPTNANAIRFDFIFYTYEFPNYICSDYNDFFVALLDPPPEGTISGNVSFDNQGNPVSVNNGYLEVCRAQNAGGKDFDCPQGTALLQGTGYEPGASTGWLQTIAPVTPGSEITLMFAIWDAGDHALNSTAIIDNISFDVTDSSVPVTQPPPK